ncbi:hypothetical protein H0H93_004530, partial [Arthromyces matolae]
IGDHVKLVAGQSVVAYPRGGSGMDPRVITGDDIAKIYQVLPLTFSPGQGIPDPVQTRDTVRYRIEVTRPSPHTSMRIKDGMREAPNPIAHVHLTSTKGGSVAEECFDPGSYVYLKDDLEINISKNHPRKIYPKGTLIHLSGEATTKSGRYYANKSKPGTAYYTFMLAEVYFPDEVITSPSNAGIPHAHLVQ